MSKQLVSGKHRLRNTYWSLVGAASATILSVQPVMAETIWDRFSTIMRDIYGQLVGISTIVAVTVAAIALLVRMVSRNQRAVDEATSWLKRVVVTWIILNTLGFIVAYLQPLIAGGQYRQRADGSLDRCGTDRLCQRAELQPHAEAYPHNGIVAGGQGPIFLGRQVGARLERCLEHAAAGDVSRFSDDRHDSTLWS